jgi:predicted nucleic acid-binding Zn ribbon protein
MTWTSIKKILPQKIAALKLENTMKLYDLSQDWDEILKKSLGDGWQKKSKPIRLKNKTLIIACRNSVWANELQLKESTLLNRIRYKIKEVEKIKVVS